MPGHSRRHSAARHSSWAAVKSELDASPAEGALVTLWAADLSAPAGVFVRTGASAYRLIGKLKLYLLNASSGLSIGTDASDDIQRLGATAAPTWGALGSSTGGLILDGSGGVALNFLGKDLDGGSYLHCAGRVVPAVSAAADGQEWAVGLYSPSAGEVLGGGMERITGAWYRQCLYSTHTAPLSLNTASAGYAVTAGPAAASMGMSMIPTDAVADTGAFLAGSYSADSGPAAVNNRASAGSALCNASEVDFVPWFWSDDATGTLTARLTEIDISEVAP